MHPLMTPDLAKTRANETMRVAPLWHSVLLVAYLLIPVAYWPGARFVVRWARQKALTAYGFELTYQVVALGIVMLGLLMKDRRICELLGRTWNSAWDMARDIVLALWFWLLAIGVGIFTYLVFGESYTGTSHLLPNTPADLLVFIPVATFAGLCEEVVFRGYLLAQCKSLVGRVEIAVVVQAVLFAASHGYHQTLGGVLNHFFVGIAFGILAVWRRSLVPGIISHCWLDISAGASILLFR